MLTGLSSSSIGNKWSHPKHVKKKNPYPPLYFYIKRGYKSEQYHTKITPVYENGNGLFHILLVFCRSMF